MVRGVGVDIEEINRFSQYVKPAHPFLKKIFTNPELKYCFSKSAPAPHLAARFAAKEAIIKATTSLLDQPLRFNAIEIYLDKHHVPQAHLSPPMPQYTIHISLAHSTQNAIAFAIISQI